ncbi:MAG: hypothetical protein J7484_05890 [Microbacterium sp.]|nr:hypothetical protein [Microbacterium sp.]
MTEETAIYRRVLRRETHAPRTAPAVLVAGAAAVLALVGVGAVIWWAVDVNVRGPIETAAGTTAGTPRALLVGAGAVAIVVAVLMLGAALLPGRRARHARTTDRVALVVDDGVLADAVADAVSADAGVDRRQVSVTLLRRGVRVTITPTSGVPVDKVSAAQAAERTVAAIGFPATALVAVASEGVVA